MRLTNSRYYLDFNATSPLAPSVVEWLSKGDFLFANPSGLHFQAKESRKEIEACRARLINTLFKNHSKDYQLFYHSGATEGINTLIKGIARAEFLEGRKIHFICFTTDHSVAINQIEELHQFGHTTSIIAIDHNGIPDRERLFYEVTKNKNILTLINITLLNNETGLVFPREIIDELFHLKGPLLLGDAAQLPGKIENWREHLEHLDAYSFSGHKFGAFKNSGFTFFNSSRIRFFPLHVGGAQENGLRSGTVDPIGVKSIDLALSDLLTYDLHRIRVSRDEFEQKILDHFADKITVVARESAYRGVNTSPLILRQGKIDSLLLNLDLNGLDVGRGAACASGLTKGNRVFKAMGFSEDESRQSLRVSFPLDCHDFQKIIPIFMDSLKRV